MKTFVFVLSLVLSPLLMPMQSKANDAPSRQMAMDLAWQRADMYHEVQRHGSGNQHYLNVLTLLVKGYAFEEELLQEYVDKWHAEYDGDLEDAINWCLLQENDSFGAPTRQIWQSRASDIAEGRITYQTAEGVTFDQVHAWAYLYRFYHPSLVTDITD